MDSRKLNKLARVDLNLIISLNVLLKERNATQAAKVMFVSQSAMSRNLQRLRYTFSDPLFTRTAKGLVPTVKALELEKELQVVLPQLSALFGKDEFDPAECEEVFSISMPSYLGSLTIPNLSTKLLTEAPKTSLVEMAAKSNPFDLLDSGKLDFAVHYAALLDPKYEVTNLGIMYPELIVRRGHPLDSPNPSLEQLVNYPFVAMAVEEDHKQAFYAPLQKLLNHWGKQPNARLRSTQSQVLFDVALNTDAVIFGINALASLPQFDEHFTSVFSFKSQPEYHVDQYLIQHRRTASSPAHQWFHDQITQTMRNTLLY
jgi:DNA-binding transcriptional LysR family regulator